MEEATWLKVARAINERLYDTRNLPPHATGSGGAAARAMGVHVEEEDVD